jgi:hypothetical protein
VPGLEEGILIVGFLALLLNQVSLGLGLISRRVRELIAASVCFAIALSVLFVSFIDGFERLSLVIVLLFVGIGAVGFLRYRGVRISL